MNGRTGKMSLLQLLMECPLTLVGSQSPGAGLRSRQKIRPGGKSLQAK